MKPVDYIFVFSSGMKTGSTLVQRYLNSHKDILIWGENLSLDILNSHDLLSNVADRFAFNLDQYLDSGYNQYIPRLFLNSEQLYPYIYDYINDMLQGRHLDYIRHKSIFGFKQVQYTCDYILLLNKYLKGKNIKYIYLTRNAVDCYLSCKKSKQMELWNCWGDVNESFIRLEGQLDNILVFRYEDIIEDPINNFAVKVSDYLNIDTKCFDINVFDLKLGSSNVTEDDFKNITDADLCNIYTYNVIKGCKRFGYDIL